FGARGSLAFEQYFTLAKGALDAGDVARDLGNADDAPGRAFDRGYGDGNVQVAAVLADAHRFEVVYPLPAAKLLEDFGFFVEAVGWEQDGDALADIFLGCVSEDPIGGFVPALDDAVQVLTDDRVVRGGDYGRKQRLRLFLRT